MPSYVSPLGVCFASLKCRIDAQSTICDPLIIKNCKYKYFILSNITVTSCIPNGPRDMDSKLYIPQNKLQKWNNNIL